MDVVSLVRRVAVGRDGSVTIATVPIRWSVVGVVEGELAVWASDDLGAVDVDLVVVAVAAQQAEIVDVRGAAVLPMNDVMGLAPVS